MNCIVTLLVLLYRFGLLGITESDSDDDIEAAMNTLDKLYETFFDGQAVAEEGNDSIEENHHSGDHPGITMNRDHFECFDECHHSTKIVLLLCCL